MYTTVSNMLALLPNIGSLSDLTSAAIVEAYIKPAEAEVNARIVRAYNVPVPGVVPLLEAISTDMAIYRCLALRVFTAAMLKNSTWPDKYAHAVELLKEIVEGKMTLVDSAGAVIEGRGGTTGAYSDTMTYQSTFHIGGSWEDQVKDSTRTDDENNARDLGV